MSSRAKKKADLFSAEDRILIEKELDPETWDRNTWKVHVIIELLRP